jgi:glucokinase
MRSSPPSSAPWLVADVGGTNIRFGLARSGHDGAVALDQIRALRVDSFPTPAAATRLYLDGVGVEPAGAIYAVAGPTDGESAQLTNHRWSFVASALRATLGVPTVALINDFAAVAHALPALTGADLSTLGPELRPAAAGPRTYAVLGPGTGLGVGALTMRRGVPLVLETEAGHASLAPETAEEMAVLAHLGRRYGRVSWERALCGSGLVDLYHALASLQGTPVDATMTPETVTERANAHADPHCVRAIEVFCGLLGAFAGDMTLTFGAWDGVFLAGGLPVPLASWLETGAFRQRFENKGRFAAKMAQVPVALIRHPYPGLLGAACQAIASTAGSAA